MDVALVEFVKLLSSAGDVASLVLACGIWVLVRVVKRIEALERRVLILELQRGGVETAIARKAIEGVS